MSARPNRCIPRHVAAPNGALLRTKTGMRYVGTFATWSATGEPTAIGLGSSDCLETLRARSVRYWRTLSGPTRAPYGEGTTWQIHDLVTGEPVQTGDVCACPKHATLDN